MSLFRRTGADLLRILESAIDPATEAGRVLLYGKNSGGATKLFMRDSAGAVIEVGPTTAASGTFSPPEVWTSPNVQASVSNLAMSAQVSTEHNTIKMTRNGSVVGLSTRLTSTILAGTLTVTVTKNGSPMTLSIVHVSGLGTQAVQAVGVDAYIAGDLIGISITTNAGFSPAGTDLEAWIQCSEAASGVAGDTVMAIGGTVTGGSNGAVLYSSGSQLGQDSTKLSYDSTNKRLGVGTNVPGATLDVADASTLAAIALRAGSTAPVSAVNTGRLRYNESTQRFQTSENGGAYANLGSGGGGGIAVWAPGSYNAGETVIRDPYLWAATTTTSEDPFLSEGNLGAIADWTFQMGGTPGTSQTPGASDGAPNGKILLINNNTGSSATAYRQSVNSGFLGKMLAIDLQISGTADWLYFGLYDSSLAQTFSDLLITTGFYGVNIFIYTPSTAKIENIINGTVGTNVAYTNANSTNAGSGFSRWYLKMIQNGSNWDLELLRDARVAGASPYSGFDPEQIDTLIPIARFTNVARPSYTNWRFVVGARTGGSAGIFSCRAAYVRDIISGAWRCLGNVPTLF